MERASCYLMQSPCSKQIQLDRITQGSVQLAFKNLQGGNFVTLPGNQFQSLTTVTVGFFLYIKSKFPILQFVSIAFCLSAVHLRGSISFIFVSSDQVSIDHHEISP